MSVCLQSGNQKLRRTGILSVGSFQDSQAREGRRQRVLLLLAGEAQRVWRFRFLRSSEFVQIFHCNSERQGFQFTPQSYNPRGWMWDWTPKISIHQATWSMILRLDPLGKLCSKSVLRNFQNDLADLLVLVELLFGKTIGSQCSNPYNCNGHSFLLCLLRYGPN